MLKSPSLTVFGLSSGFMFSSVVVVCFSLFRFCFLETGFSCVALAAPEHSQ